MNDVSGEARRTEEAAPSETDQEDRLYEAYVRQAIEAGIADSEAGRTVRVEEVRAEYGLT